MLQGIRLESLEAHSHASTRCVPIGDSLATDTQSLLHSTSAQTRHLLTLMCERLQRHIRLVQGRPSFHPETRQEFALELARAVRDGRDQSASFEYLRRDLCARLGTDVLNDALLANTCSLALAISRRIRNPMAENALSMGAVRMVGRKSTEDRPLHGTLTELGECARVDLRMNDDLRESMGLAIAVDNAGARTAWASSIEVRVQVQTRESGVLLPTGIHLFGVQERLEAGRRSWLSFAGVNLAAQLRYDVDLSQVDAMRLLICRR